MLKHTFKQNKINEKDCLLFNNKKSDLVGWQKNVIFILNLVNLMKNLVFAPISKLVTKIKSTLIEKR